MARKWYLFLHNLQSLLKREIGWFLLLLLGSALFVGLSLGFSAPVISFPAIGEVAQSPTENLLEAGRRAYREGNFRDAIANWEQVRGEGSDRALALNYLALSYYQLGEKNRANTTIRRCLDLIENLKNSSEKQQLFARAFNTKGRLHFSKGENREALNQWREAEEYYVKSNDALGQIGTRINQAQVLQVLGNYRQALQILKGLEEPLKREPEPIKTLGFLSLGNALQNVGDLERSRDDVLEKYLLPILQQDTIEPSALTRNILMSFGNLNRALLNLRRSQLYFDEVDKILKEPRDAIEVGSDFVGFSCYTKTQENTELDIFTLYKNALCAYQKAEDLFVDSETAELREMGLQAKLNRFSLATERLKWWRDQAERRGKYQTILVQSLDLEVEEIWQDIQQQNLFNGLPVGRRGISMRLNLVESVLKWRDALSGEIEHHLSDALAEAKSLEDLRFESYTLGELGVLKHREKNDDEAKEYLQKALSSAQSMHAWDIVYQWQWQLGKIYRDRNDLQEAEKYYQLAVDNLENLQAEDLVAIDAGLDGVNSDLQVSFREKVEPVYREYVDILLEYVDRSEQPIQEALIQEKLEKARQAIDQLQLAQLKDFLRCDLQPDAPEPLDKIVDTKAPKTAIFYPIVLRDRLRIIAKFPNQKLSYEKPKLNNLNVQEVTAIKVEEVINILRPNFERIYIEQPILDQSKQVYTWLIEPFEEQLKTNEINTLVFVLDTPLQNLPIAALYHSTDGKSGKQGRYLVEDYAIALNPGLQLAKAPTSFQKLEFNPLLAGLSQKPELEDVNLSPLPFVEKELEKIREIFIEKNIEPEIISNDEFTRQILEEAIKFGRYNLVHLATHGKFSSNPEETWIITKGENQEEKVRVNELGNLLQERQEAIPQEIELLILSACETATVDTRAAIGIAGVAIRSGARSTLASLWSLKDAPTAEFMIRFYDNLLTPNISKAQALRLTQVSFLEEERYQHPIYWAPFVLLGNWL
jgi:CHAT domain-containing protein/tetratricopeptide (TPR) repeat protein